MDRLHRTRSGQPYSKKNSNGLQSTSFLTRSLKLTEIITYINMREFIRILKMVSIQSVNFVTVVWFFTNTTYWFSVTVEPLRTNLVIYMIELWLRTSNFTPFCVLLDLEVLSRFIDTKRDSHQCVERLLNSFF